MVHALCRVCGHADLHVSLDMLISSKQCLRCHAWANALFDFTS